MNRRECLEYVAGVAALGPTTRADAGRMSARPNVLPFFTDDQRASTIRALGNPDVHTPNLDPLVVRDTAITLKTPVRTCRRMGCIWSPA